MILNTPLGHKLSICYYNTDVDKDRSDYRSSRPEVFYRKVVLRNLTKLTGKHLCQSLYFNKVADLRQLHSKRGFAQVLSYEFCEIFINFFYRTHPVVFFLICFHLNYLLVGSDYLLIIF